MPNVQRQLPEHVIITTHDSQNPNITHHSRSPHGSSTRSPRMRILARVSSTSMRRMQPFQTLVERSAPAAINNNASDNSGHHLPRSVPIHSLDYFGFRGPYMPAYSSPDNVAYGSQLDYNLGWMPKDIHLSDMIDSSILRARARKVLPTKYLQRVDVEKPSDVDAQSLDQTSEILDSRFLLNQPFLIDPTQAEHNKSSSKKESLIEWFDRIVEKELEKRRNESFSYGEKFASLDASACFPRTSTPKKPLNVMHPLILETNASGVNVDVVMRDNQSSELMEAVDSLARAEALCTFEGAVRAAEQAAASVPPELVEEAAAAGAQDFTAEITSTVKEEIPGTRPIEVVGYVGITRPKLPKKTKVFQS